MENKFKHLTEVQRNELLELLQKTKEFSDETLDTWKTGQVNFELKENPKQIFSRTYTVLKVHE